MASVKLENVKKIYEGGVVAVHDFSLNVENKEFVVLVGPSGCGKSTTLRMIAGLEEASEGRIFIDGQLVNDLPPKDRDIAMVFQNYALYPHMTVRENMGFGLKLRKFPKIEINKRVNEAADILEIGQYLDRKPKALSGGQRQRVAVGRAIVRKPKVFLFDEPLSNLDAKLRVQMRTEISKLHKKLGATMIYVTHDQTEAMTMADKIVLMKDGFVQQIASPMEIYNSPSNKFVAGFIGSPAMNFMEGKIEISRGMRIRMKDARALLPVDKRHEKKLKSRKNSNVIFGIRPEHIYLSADKGRGKAVLQAQVEVVEPMGNETLLYFKTSPGGAQHVARLNYGGVIPKPGKNVEINFDMAKAYFFDPEKENAIS